LPGLPPEAPETPVLNLLFFKSFIFRCEAGLYFLVPVYSELPVFEVILFWVQPDRFQSGRDDPLSFGFSGICVPNQNTLKIGS
jgi:hypothetical protein